MNIDRIQPTIATTIAPRKAAPKSATWNPRWSCSLMAEVPTMRDAGVDVVRVSPQAESTSEVLRLFRSPTRPW